MNGCKFNNQDTKFCFLFSKIMDELRIYFIIYTLFTLSTGSKGNTGKKRIKNISVARSNPNCNFTDLNMLAVFHFRFPNNLVGCTSKLSSFDQPRLV